MSADLTHRHDEFHRGLVPQDQLGTGSDGSGTHFLADDQTYKPGVGLTPSIALVIAECNSPPANSTGATVLAWDTFYDQQGATIGTGAPTDAAVIAAFATLGLTVDSTGQFFTVATDGIFAVRVDAQPVPPTVNESTFFVRKASHPGGYIGYYGPTAVAPAGSTSGRGISVTDALVIGDSFEVAQKGTDLEQDIGYAAMSILKVR